MDFTVWSSGHHHIRPGTSVRLFHLVRSVQSAGHLPAYHPQSNDMVDRAHWKLNDSLRAGLTSSDWPRHLPWLLLGFRAVSKEHSGISLPLSWCWVFVMLFQSSCWPQWSHRCSCSSTNSANTSPSLRTRLLTYAQAAASVRASLFSVQFVYIQSVGLDPLSPCYKVLARSQKFFTVEVGGRSDTISVDRLKTHLGCSPVTPASPPCLAGHHQGGSINLGRFSPRLQRGGGPLILQPDSRKSGNLNSRNRPLCLVCSI